jgi:hypothetical protein
MMRRLLVVGGIVAGCLAIAATVAFAANNTVTYDSKLTPAHPKPKPGKPANIGYEGILNVSTADGKQPDSGPSTVIFFSKQVQNNAKKFPSPCKATDIDGKPSIPAKCKPALVGGGEATSFAGVPGQTPALTEQLSVVAYNANKGKQLLLVLNQKPGQPVPIVNRVIVGTFASASGTFGNKVTFAVPADLQNVGGLQVALTHFDVKLSKSKTAKVKGKKVTYLQLKSCPSSKKLPTRTTVTFDNSAGAGMPAAGPPITVDGTVPC